MNLDLHGERAALRGNPSFVWRAGQERRLALILQLSQIHGSADRQILVNGCGTGMYARALRPFVARPDQIHAIDIEPDHLELAVHNAPGAALQLAACEELPYADGVFDLILSHEVLEHVRDDRQAAAEMARTLRPGGRAIIFVPNRLYPFETHGHYWRGDYHFGNTPLINYLPDSLRNRLAPHVRTYTHRTVRELFLGQPVRICHLSQIFPGYDNILHRRPAVGRLLRRVTYALERSPLAVLGISHVLVVERTEG